MVKRIKHYEFHIASIANEKKRCVGVVKFVRDLRVESGYFLVFSNEDFETIIGVRTDKVESFHLIPVVDESWRPGSSDTQKMKN